MSVIITCKGRLHHLRQTLPSVLSQECAFPFEVIVVDFGCPQGTFAWCASLDVHNLVSLQVCDATETFHLSRARNCGAQLARGRVLEFLDADVFVEDGWLETASRPLLAGRAGISTIAGGFGANWGRFGSCLVTADVFHAVRGYDEGLRGWGPEDADFSARCLRRTRHIDYNPFLLAPIEHDESERVQFRAEASIDASSRRNQAYLRSRCGVVNPRGYGRGTFVVLRGVGGRLPPPQVRRRVSRIRPATRRPAVAHAIYATQGPHDEGKEVAAMRSPGTERVQ